MGVYVTVASLVGLSCLLTIVDGILISIFVHTFIPTFILNVTFYIFTSSTIDPVLMGS